MIYYFQAISLLFEALIDKLQLRYCADFGVDATLITARAYLNSKLKALIVVFMIQK